MKGKSINRVSVGLDAQTVEALNQALSVRYGDSVNRMERGRFLQLAIFAYSSAVARLGKDYFCGMLACDVRMEHSDEQAFRLGEPLQEPFALPPDNIVALFPDEVSAA